MLTVNSNTSWKVINETNWCNVDKTSGYNTAQLIVSVDSNDTKQPRTTDIRIVSDNQEVTVSVAQDTLSGEHHYRLPVVFHIIYDKDHDNASDTVQNIKTETIHWLVDGCNALYRNNFNSIDMNVELTLADTDPTGQTMETPGIHRVLRTTAAVFDPESFLQETNTGNADLMWDPNKYVNVYVFQFTQSKNNILGISHLALTPRQNSLPGLTANNLFYTQIPNFPWGIALNNAYLYNDNAYTTLAHELGHYLGLFHIFADADCPAQDPDWCDDTPFYNRQEYLTWLEANKDNLQLQELFQRTSCNGDIFTSLNIMDYDFSYMNQFTAAQHYRIRHVLENSPLIPGPKNISVTKSLIETEKPVIRIMR